MSETASQQQSVSTAALRSGRIKYAEPRSLPSFPSPGLRSDGAAASAAASLGWSSQKSIEPWRPEKMSSASAAAVLAKDYKMSPAWEPSANSAGARAAILAVDSAGEALKHPQVGPGSATRTPKASQGNWGSSAAVQAFHANRPIAEQEAKSTHGSSAATQAFNTSRSHSAKKSMSPPSKNADRSLAARGAMLSAPRRRSMSTPISPHRAGTSTLESTAAASALNGAAWAHRASMQQKAPLGDAGAVSVTTMTRNMFTSHPPVKPETDEQQSNDRIHQSAVAMAKKMYAQQQRMLDQTKDAHRDRPGSAQESTYLNLQDAAYKQAQDRLAKLQDEHHKSRELQEYYGTAAAGPPVSRRRFSVTSKLRRRASSDGDMDDRMRSERIRQEMSMFSHKLSEVDKNKREHDREVLLAAAQRNVKARLQGMDERAYSESGKVHPSRLTDWEAKAQQAAQSRQENRSENRGKLDLGGGFFMTPDEVDAIAARRVQPILDDINERAERERERQATFRADEEARKDERERQKARDYELKEINKKVKEQERREEKEKRLQEKVDEKARRDEEKAAKVEQKRQAKGERRKSKTEPVQGVVADGAPTEAVDNEGVEERESQSPRESRSMPTFETVAESEARKNPEHSTSPTSKVRGWIKNRFSRGKSLSEHGEKRRKSFVGGAALKEPEAQNSNASLEHRSTSMRDVAMAGKTADDDSDGPHDGPVASGARRDSQGVSPVGSDSDEVGDHEETWVLAPPKPMDDPAARTSTSSNRDSRFKEIIDQ